MADAKDTYGVNDLRTVANFTDAFQDFLTEWSMNGNGIRVKDAMITIEDEEKPRGAERQPWGLVTLLDADEVTVQYEQGNYEIGLN